MMNSYIKIKAYLLLLILLIFTACQSDDEAPIIPPNPPENLINGFWSIPDKGWVFEFTDDNDIFYNTNAAGCAIQNNNFVPEKFFGFTYSQVNENEIIATSELSDSDVTLVRLPNQNPDCLPDQISDTKDPVVNFDHFWNIFNDYYAFFEARNIDWTQYESVRDKITEDNFYDTLEVLAYALDDSHVSINDEKNGIEINAGDPTLLERLNANLSGDLIIDSFDDFLNLGNQKLNTIFTEYLDGNIESDKRENIFWGAINGDIGYVNIISMIEYGTNFEDEISTLNDVLDLMMDDIKNAGVSKLIIDIRFNDGGHDTVALDIVSRFLDQERVSYFKKARLGDGFTENKSFSVAPKGDFQFTGDIVLLTSPYTVSAGELFALCMKDLPYVTIAGENTAGAFSTILTHVLPNGAEIGLSNEIYSDAQGQVFEIVGIGPKNKENQVPFLSTLDFQEEKDSGINRALELLNN